jgi:hypothetical protein
VARVRLGLEAQERRRLHATVHGGFSEDVDPRPELIRIPTASSSVFHQSGFGGLMLLGQAARHASAVEPKTVGNPLK